MTQLKKTLFPQDYGQMNIDKMVLKRENDRDKCKSVIKEIANKSFKPSVFNKDLSADMGPTRQKIPIERNKS